MSVNVSLRLKGSIPLLTNLVRYRHGAGGVTGALAACPARHVSRASSHATIGGQLVMAARSAIL